MGPGNTEAARRLIFPALGGQLHCKYDGAAGPGVNSSLTARGHADGVLSATYGGSESDKMYDLDAYFFEPDPQATEALVGLPVADVERNLILATLRHTDGNRTHAANVLGISLRTMRNKLREYAQRGIQIPASASHEA